MPTATSAYISNLQKHEQIAEGTMAFSFAKPLHFDFRAGQSIDLTLINPSETDAGGNTRAFSIASAPFDADLMIATRMRDTAFKRVLRSASPRLEVKVEGPSGSFTLHKNSAKAGVFLTGGIGITPFLSIIRQATRENLPHQLYLFYSNRRPEDAAFLDLLQQAAQQNNRFQCNIRIARGQVKPGSSTRIWCGGICPRHKARSITSQGRRPWSRPCGRCWSEQALTKMISAPRNLQVISRGARDKRRGWGVHSQACRTEGHGSSVPLLQTGAVADRAK